MLPYRAFVHLLHSSFVPSIVLYLPFSQFLHASFSVDLPSTSPYLPFKHKVHSSFVPSDVEYLPISQAPHAFDSPTTSSAIPYFPRTQLVQDVASVLILYFPLSHVNAFILIT